MPINTTILAIPSMREADVIPPKLGTPKKLAQMKLPMGVRMVPLKVGSP